MNQQSQTSLRQQALRARRSLTPRERESYSQVIANNFFSSSYFQRAQHIGLYLSFAEEVCTGEIVLRSWRTKKSIYAPVINDGNQLVFQLLTPETPLAANQYGILEPTAGAVIQARKLDVVLTPVAAFDSNKNRIGMGGGYYDRYFAYLRHRQSFRKPKLLGLAFACQQVVEIPPNPWDISLCDVLTENNG